MPISMLEQRRIEAAALARVYRNVRERRGDDEALHMVRLAAEIDAREAGKAFAAQAENGPSLAHFATIVDRWRGEGVLDIEDFELTDTQLSFTVVRCGYVEAYLEMGLPQELAPALSCCRDEPFGQGYSPRLRLERPHVIAEGAASCPFTFVWE